MPNAPDVLPTACGPSASRSGLTKANCAAGDAWDAKIKAQIRSGALLVPIISGQTQQRAEGYFRREWKIGVERTHDMAAARAFIVPVVVDGTRESDALVPEEFMRFQWTRLSHGMPTPQFIEPFRGMFANPQAARPRGTNSPLPAAPTYLPATRPASPEARATAPSLPSPTTASAGFACQVARVKWQPSGFTFLEGENGGEGGIRTPPPL